MLLAVVAHEAQGSRRTKDGVTQRAYWEASAAKGSVEARQQMEGPPVPDALGYLYDWWLELSAGRAEGMSGPAPLTHETIASWARLMDHEPEPHEVMALLTMDAAWRTGLRGDAPVVASDTPKVVPAWPTRKETA